MNKHKTRWQHVSAMKLILCGYIVIILLGTLILSLPTAARNGVPTPFSDSLFTATSATCVTGLIRFDTFSHWSTFGQVTILCLIQIGGIGFMTVALVVMMLTGKKIGLFERSLMQDSISAPELGGIVRMTRFIICGTFLIEGVGAVLLAVYYVPAYGAKGLFFSLFHSISAFCNGGFDLMGGITGECSSMTGLEENLYVNLVLMALIIIGGLGFYVWRDLLVKKFHWRFFTLQTKIVLTTSGILVFGGAAALFLTEHNGLLYEGYSPATTWLSCLFQSVSARTAGFNTADLTKMSDSGLLIMIFLMLVGGSSGSTAGGMKTTTLYVLFASVFSTLQSRKNLEAFGRRLDNEITRTASCIFVSYLTAILLSTVAIASIEHLPAMTVLFETTSATATVGITLGITGSLHMASKLIITFLMFCGRLGSITVLMAFAPHTNNTVSRYPLEKIQLG